MSRIAAALILIAALLGALALGGVAGRGDSPSKRSVKGKKRPLRRVARKLGTLKQAAIDESSGLAPSRLRKGVLWTHNDSGSRGRIFALDTRGRHLGAFAIPGVKAFDLEDMASVRIDGKSYLVLADTGDNGRRRKSCAIYILEEPQLQADSADKVGRAPCVRSLRFRFPDGAEDCEAMAVDPTSKEIYLLAKRMLPRTRLYVLPWPERTPHETVVARAVAEPRIALVTGMDISPDGRRALVLTYTAAFEYDRRGNETWAEAFGRKPKWVPIPPLGQAEGACYGPQARRVYLSSEGRHSALWEIDLDAPRTAKKGKPAPRR